MENVQGGCFEDWHYSCEEHIKCGIVGLLTGGWGYLACLVVY